MATFSDTPRIRLQMETLAIVAGCELGIMFLLPVILPGVTGWVEAAADTLLLTVTAGPLLWWRFSRRCDESKTTAASAAAASALRRVRIAGIAGLTCVALLALGGAAAMELAARMSAARTELVDKTGRQRMLGQRLAVAAVMRTLYRSETQQGAFEAALEEYGAAAGMLRDRLVGPDADFSHDSEVTPLWNEALAAIHRVLAAGRTLAETFDQGQTDRAALDELLTGCSAAIERLDALNKAMAANNPSGADAMIPLGRGLGLLLVSALVLVWLLAIEPAVQRAAQVEEALRRGEALLRAIIEYTPDGIVAADGTGKIRLANPAVERMLGYGSGELVGQPLTAIIPERLRETHCHGVKRLLAGGEPRLLGKLVEVAALRRDGGELPVELVVGMARHDQEIVFTASLRDITQRKATELRMRQLAGAVEAADDAIVLTDINGNMVQVNPAFLRTTGYTAGEVIGQNPRVLKSGQQPPKVYERLWATITAGQVWRGRFINRRKDGSLYHADVSISPTLNDEGRVVGYVGVQRDVTAEIERAQELATAARSDKLTGLPNRALLLDRLQLAIERAKRLPEYQFAIMFLDFDRFKMVNDSLGHEYGDRLLQAIAARLRAAVRAGDSLSRAAEGTTAARLGGDEFVVLLDGVKKPQDAATVADRLLKSLEAPYQLGEHEVHSTASIGIVCSHAKYDKADEILRDADTAMYEAKARGRACWVMFDASMQTAVRRRLQIENDLRAAIGSDQLFLVYQPIVSLEDGELRGVEALIRWNHPTRGLVTPGEFIPIAEETRLILPLSNWIFEQACTQFMQWQRQAPDRAPACVSVNLSRIHLAEQDLVERIVRTVQRAGMEPGQLQLEVTESGIMQNREAAKNVLKALKAAGIRLAMDDFGTGHSSLSCLHEFPFDMLKIDRSFIINLERGRQFIALTHSVVTLAEYLGMVCVAEGVENLNQIAALQSMGWICAQGHYFGKPMSPEALIDGDWMECFRRRIRETSQVMV